ncbi:MAG: DUF3164 family protein [Dysgonamonadaceae bacterium]|jgi:hypothetical protein|nr:DUF3164 family protein [Dysgonamonadaceae bacterium]
MEEKEKQTVEMTAAERAEFEFFKQERAKKAAAEQRKSSREIYRGMVDEEVTGAIPALRDLSGVLMRAKKKVFDDFRAILDMKSDIMHLTKDGQQSHTFTDRENRFRLMLGVYMLDGYDDTVESGIAMVREYISSLAGDNPQTQALVAMVIKLLARDNAGNLKASRVVQLQKFAEESEDALFLEGVRIIRESYRPTPSKTFLRAEERDENGGWRSIPLGMTEV